MKIAIVGGGVSGLVAAWLLAPKHDVTLFESDDRLGGHVHTVPVEEDGNTVAVDTGFIVYNERHYPLFTKLLATWGVETMATTMGFSVKCPEPDLEYNGHSLLTLFAQKRNLARPWFYRMLLEIVRFANRVERDLPGMSYDLSVEDYLRETRVTAAFRDYYFLPLGSALWSIARHDFDRFSARFVLEFLQNHDMLRIGGRPTWRVIRGGSQRYVDRLLERTGARFVTNRRVRRVVREPGKTGDAGEAGEAAKTERVRIETSEDTGLFDHAVLACHADSALAMLADPDETEREILESFPTTRNRITLHTDDSILPRRRSCWASWNYRLAPDRFQSATVTYNMNILQRLDARRTYCVTLNDEDQVRPDSILRRMEYRHPVFGKRRVEAQKRRQEMIGRRNVSFCGAYWGYGFHEDGVRSACEVAELWECRP
ncbi:MAG: NAD(P)-binding protein [Gemmatimonadetes bacterium]|nr:NAD(P)-binding protein [Gemmatimonadota bacterium]